MPQQQQRQQQQRGTCLPYTSTPGSYRFEAAAAAAAVALLPARKLVSRSFASNEPQKGLVALYSLLLQMESIRARPFFAIFERERQSCRSLFVPGRSGTLLLAAAASSTRSDFVWPGEICNVVRHSIDVNRARAPLLWIYVHFMSVRDF